MLLKHRLGWKRSWKCCGLRPQNHGKIEACHQAKSACTLVFGAVIPNENHFCQLRTTTNT